MNVSEEEKFDEIVESIFNTMKQDSDQVPISLESLQIIAQKMPARFAMKAIPLIENYGITNKAAQEMIQMVDRAICQSIHSIDNLIDRKTMPDLILSMISVHLFYDDARTAFEFLSAARAIASTIDITQVPTIEDKLSMGAYSLIVASAFLERFPNLGHKVFFDCFDNVTARPGTSEAEVISLSTSLCVYNQLSMRGIDTEYRLSNDSVDKAVARLFMLLKTLPADFSLKGIAAGLSMVSADKGCTMLLENRLTLIQKHESVNASTKLYLGDGILSILDRNKKNYQSSSELWASLLCIMIDVQDFLKEDNSDDLKIGDVQHLKYMDLGYQIYPQVVEDTLSSLPLSPATIWSIGISLIVAKDKHYEGRSLRLYKRLLECMKREEVEEHVIMLMKTLTKVSCSIIMDKQSFWNHLSYVANAHKYTIIVESPVFFDKIQSECLQMLAVEGLLPQKIRFTLFCRLIRSPSLQKHRQLFFSLASKLIPQADMDVEPIFFSMIAFCLLEIQQSVDQHRFNEDALTIMLYIAKQEYQGEIDLIEQNIDAADKDELDTWFLIREFSKMMDNQAFITTLLSVYVSLFHTKNVTKEDFLTALYIIRPALCIPHENFVYDLLMGILQSKAMNDSTLYPGFLDFFEEIIFLYPSMAFLAVKYAANYIGNNALFYRMFKSLIDKTDQKVMLQVITEDVLPLFTYHFELTSPLGPNITNALDVADAIANLFIVNTDTVYGDYPEKIQNRIIHNIAEVVDHALKSFNDHNKTVLRRSFHLLPKWLSLSKHISDEQRDLLFSVIKSNILDTIAGDTGVDTLAAAIALHIHSQEGLFDCYNNLLHSTLGGSFNTTWRILSCVLSMNLSLIDNHVAIDASTMNIRLRLFKMTAYVLPLSFNDDPIISNRAIELLTSIHSSLYNQQQLLDLEDANSFLANIQPDDLIEITTNLINLMTQYKDGIPTSDHMLALRLVIPYVANVIGIGEKKIFNMLLSTWEKASNWSSEAHQGLIQCIDIFVNKAFDTGISVILQQASKPTIQDLFVSLCKDTELRKKACTYLFYHIHESTDIDSIDSCVKLLNRLLNEPSHGLFEGLDGYRDAQASVVAMWKLISVVPMDYQRIQTGTSFLTRVLRCFRPNAGISDLIITQSTTVAQIYEFIAGAFCKLEPRQCAVVMDALFAILNKQDPMAQMYLWQLLSVCIYKWVVTIKDEPTKDVSQVCTNFCIAGLTLLRKEVNPTQVLSGLRRAFWATESFNTFIPSDLGQELFVSLVDYGEGERLRDVLYCMNILHSEVDPDHFISVLDKMKILFTKGLEAEEGELNMLSTSLLEHIGPFCPEIVDWCVSVPFNVLSLLRFLFFGDSQSKEKTRKFLVLCARDPSNMESELSPPDDPTSFVVWALMNIILHHKFFSMRAVIEAAFLEIKNKKHSEENKVILGIILPNLHRFGLSKEDSDELRRSFTNKIKSNTKTEAEMSIRTLPLLV